jgi:dipeptidyl aminopeptidase/acylaminoacyl peptidase
MRDRSARTGAMRTRRFVVGTCGAALPICIASAIAFGGARFPHRVQTRIEHVYALRNGETVFAYARISPDGRRLAYSSETRDPTALGRYQRTVRVIDLATQQVVFEEGGLDPYWSPDSARLIFRANRPLGVSVLDLATGSVTRNIADERLGDYFSWGRQNGRDVILTILGHYYSIDGASAVSTWETISPCPGWGTGERPLLSRDARRISAFHDGTVIVRNLRDCGGFFDTHLRGAKADWSPDGRRIAFHMQKPTGRGYRVVVVDLFRRRMMPVGDLPGSSFYPSWTDDGRLCFRYDSDDFKGFVIADGFDQRGEPLPTTTARSPTTVLWRSVFPEQPEPKSAYTVAMVWATWGAHCQTALADLEEAISRLRAVHIDAASAVVNEPVSNEKEVRRVLRRLHSSAPHFAVAPERLWLTRADNQIPALMLFKGETLVARRLGAQTVDELVRWIREANSNGDAAASAE